MSTIRLVAWREFVERVRSRAFLVANTFLVLVFAGLGLAASVLTSPPGPLVVGAVGRDGAEVAALLAAPDGSVLDLPDRAAGEAAVREGAAELVVVDGSTVLAAAQPSAVLQERIASAVADAGRARALSALGVPPSDAAPVLSPPPAEVVVIATAARGIDLAVTPVAAAAAFGTLLYGLLAIFGQWVAQGIVEEKQSRVVEILLGAARPTPLLVGRVLGLGALGLFQLGLLGSIGAVAVVARGGGLLPDGAAGAVALVLAWYVPGFLLYALLFSISGSLVSRVEDLQSSIIIPVVLLIGSIVAVQVITVDPTSALARAATFVPFTVPILLPILITGGLVGPLEVALATASLVLAVAALTPVAARIYRGGVLPDGGPGLRAAWRAGR